MDCNDVWLNEGTGRLGIAGTYCGDGTNVVVLGDVDGDGDLDWLAGNVGQNDLWLNDGTGQFTCGAMLPAINDCTDAIALGDVDADGGPRRHDRHLRLQQPRTE